ncbi:type II toxin-antitoxin system RelE/ParE family toxin, partial [bacterium]|nr:type II toxin-antitoxin system RelE/ParE family toxin [bacterium]
MPKSNVYFYQEDDNTAPVFEWLNEIRKKNLKAYANCISRIELLKSLGHELRRPHSDYLRDGIYELRIRSQKVQYRILYFFDGQNYII